MTEMVQKTVQFDPDQWAKLEQIAKENDRSIAAQVRVYVRRGMANEKG